MSRKCLIFNGAFSCVCRVAGNSYNVSVTTPDGSLQHLSDLTERSLQHEAVSC